MAFEALICNHVEDLESYVPPDWAGLAARAGVAPTQLIRLDANENPYGPSPRALEALASFDGYGFYPDYRALEAAVANYAGVAPENVVLGNGGDEVIDLAVRLLVAPGEGTIVCPPTFGMYAFSTQAHRGQVLSIPRRQDFALACPFQLDVEGIEQLAAAQDATVRPKLLFVTSPGNPDGQAVPPDTVRRLLRLPLAVAVDEAYIEFGGESAVPLLDECPNLIVLRTFSKWAGLAGLRLGYAVTSPEIASAMARLRPPYNINAAAVVAALATFDDMEHVKATIERILVERERLSDLLSGLPGVHAVPSQANFVLCQLEGRLGRDVADALAAQGILVRSFSAPGLDYVLRITVGRPEQNDAVIAALRGALSGTASNRASDALSTSPPRQSAGRQGSLHRQTRETDVSVMIQLDGTGRCEIGTGLGFLDHLLAQVAAHGFFDLTVRARGDVQIDEHHTVEDVAIVLGQALDVALGDRRGIVRIGSAYAPLDEALAHVVVDLSGRPYAVVDVEFSTPRIGAVDTDLIRHFLETLAFHARMSLHARVLYGRNDHHKAEALFKALGRALDATTRLDARRQGIPSTKGVL